MKYIKLFELFEEPKEVNFELKKISNEQYVYYFNIEELKFGVYFNLYGEIWERSYYRIGKNFSENDKPFGLANRIISSVTYITNHFIKKFKPIMIAIFHIPMEGEINLDKELNKRARINYEYLMRSLFITSNKYELRYYNFYNSIAKLCLIVKKGVDSHYDHNDKYERIYPK